MEDVFFQKAETEQVGVQIVVRELEDVLVRDVGNKIADDGRFVTDRQGASLFVAVWIDQVMTSVIQNSTKICDSFENICR